MVRPGEPDEKSQLLDLHRAFPGGATIELRRAKRAWALWSIRNSTLSETEPKK